MESKLQTFIRMIERKTHSFLLIFIILQIQQGAMKRDQKVTCKKESENKLSKYRRGKKNHCDSYSSLLNQKNSKKPTKKERNDSDFSLNQQQKSENKSSSYKRWKRQENGLYLEFLIDNKHMFQDQQSKRKYKVFKRLSQALEGRKSISQCKSHHQKMMAYTNKQNIDQIIDYMLTKSKFYSKIEKNKISQREFQQVPYGNYHRFSQANINNVEERGKKEHCEKLDNFLMSKNQKQDNIQHLTRRSYKYQNEQEDYAGDVKLKLFPDGKIEIAIKLAIQQFQIW